MTRPIKTILYLIIILLSLNSCCKESPYINYLKLYMDTEPKSLDPAMSSDLTTGQKISFMYDNLVTFGRGADIHPGIAKRWNISDDGKTYTFILHKNFNFWNGRSIRSQDVSYSFTRIMDRNTLSPMTWLFAPVKGAREYLDGNASTITGFSTPNDTTFIIELTNELSPFLGFLAMPAAGIVPREAVDDEAIDFGRHPLGSGPWIFEEWRPDNFVSLKKNGHYFYGPPKMDGIYIRTIHESLTASIEFESGNLDIFDVPTAEFDYWMHSKVWAPYTQSLDELATYFIGLNVERKPFDNPRIRLAAAMAIDREKIIKQVMHGSVKIANGILPPGLPGYDSTATPIPFNPDSSRQILIEEGYGDGCEFDLWADQKSGVSQLLEAIQAYLNEAGFKCRIIRNDWNMMRDAMRQGSTDAYWGNWWADYADPENFMTPLFHSYQAARRNRYSNPEVDRLIVKLQGANQDSLKSKIAHQLDALLMKEVPYIFLWYPTTYTVQQANIIGYERCLMPNANRYLNTERTHGKNNK